MTTTLSDRLPVSSRVFASSQSAGFVEKPTVADRVPAEMAAALQARTGRPSAEELAKFEDSFKTPSDFSGVRARPSARPSSIEVVTTPEDREAFAADFGRPGGFESTRPTTERVTDPAAVEAFWNDAKWL